MVFEWDDAKDDENRRKHGMSLESGARIWAGEQPVMTREDTTQSYGERREVSIGYSDTGILVVAHTERAEDVIRLISVRTAEKWEKRAYHGYCQEIDGGGRGNRRRRGRHDRR